MFVILEVIFAFVFFNSFVIARMLGLPSDDGQYWPKHVKDLFYIKLLYLIDLATNSSVKMCDGSVLL
jgi:hypothetical protein